MSSVVSKVVTGLMVTAGLCASAVVSYQIGRDSAEDQAAMAMHFVATLSAPSLEMREIDHSDAPLVNIEGQHPLIWLKAGSMDASKRHIHPLKPIYGLICSGETLQPKAQAVFLDDGVILPTANSVIQDWLKRSNPCRSRQDERSQKLHGVVARNADIITGPDKARIAADAYAGL